MDQYNKDTLANLISCELARMKDLARRADTENTARFWQDEINDLEKLDAEIWEYL